MIHWGKIGSAAFPFAGEDTQLEAMDGGLPAPAFLASGDGVRLLSLLERDGVPASPVQFLAARSGEGTSSVVRDVALVAARDLRLRVLLLDFDSPGDRQAKFLRARCATDDGTSLRSLAHSASGEWSRDMSQLAAALSLEQVGSDRLHVNTRMMPPLPSATHWRAVFSVMTDTFDLVLIDGPALDRSADGVTLSRVVASNVLVVEAEATRAAVAQNLRDRVTELGGEIAGVVLNKRRFHIPRLIYRFL